MEDNGLDGFVSEIKTEGVSSGTLTENRPKLRKIKRPKVRPIPPVSTTNIDSSINANEVTSIDDDISLSSLEELLPNVDEQPKENVAQNSIITSVEANKITSNSNFNNEIMNDFPEQFDYPDNDVFADDYSYDANYIKKSNMYIYIITCFFVGIFIGKVLFSSQTVENHGLEGVVTNPDVPKGRARCGLTDKSQACIFYLMNWYKQELNGRDFYKLAAQLTGREEYMIETENLRYATMKIRPGNIAQLNIPALK